MFILFILFVLAVATVLTTVVAVVEERGHQLPAAGRAPELTAASPARMMRGSTSAAGAGRSS